MTDTLTPADGPHVVGIDSSLTGTGLASSTGWTDVIGYPARNRHDKITKLEPLERLTAMEELAARIMLRIGQPDLALLEIPAFAASGGGGHERGWLWWEIFRRCRDYGIPLALVSINHRCLYATGKGRVPKGEIIDAVARRWPAWPTAGDDNAADAVVLMAAGRDRLGRPLAPVPKTHRAAIDRITWPAGLRGVAA